MLLSFFISIHSSLYLLCLFWGFLFLTFAAKVLEIAYWSVFIKTTLKSLSDNSDVCIISTLMSIDCLFPSNIPSYSYAILNSILNIFFSFWTFWILCYEALGLVQIPCRMFMFLFQQKNYSGYSQVAIYNPSSIGYGSIVSSVLQSHCLAPWVCPTYVPPSGHSETSSHFVLKIFDMLTRIRFTVLSSRVSFWIPKCRYWVISPSSSYPQSHRQFLVPSGLPVLVLWPELGAWVTYSVALCPMLPHLALYWLLLRGVEKGITINHQRGLSHPLGTAVLPKRKAPLP